MADNEGDKKDEAGQTSDEDKTQDTDTSDGGDGKDGQNKKKLEESSAKELISYIKELRTESKGRREEVSALKKRLDGTTEGTDELKKKLKELEDKDKSEEDLRAERLKELESAANKLPELEKYQKHVKALYGERMKVVKGMGDEVKASIDSLLEDMAKDDFLGRLKIINAVLSVTGNEKKDMSEEDVKNPAETGEGESSRTLATDLAWSSQGQQEAALAGLTKPSE